TVVPKTETEKKAWKAAQDFESLFLRQIFRSMRESTKNLSDNEEGKDDSGAGPMADMAWDGMADQVAAHGGMGLSKILYSKLLEQSGLDSGIPQAPMAPVRKAVQTAYRTTTGGTLDQAVQAASEETGLDSNLIRAVIHAESRGRTDAVSPKGALGPMQLMPATAAELGVDPRDPVENIRGGSRYLAQMKKRFGSDALAVAAYNAGPGAVERHGGIPPYPETQAYVREVLAQQGRLRGGRS
ncbi:MAG TPA: transglycosylase SLT domain-containing protein, partial [Myxococcota bacterium]|nr:transglycosylase SLT domain-containing protein [Myxococcota bacterium]